MDTKAQIARDEYLGDLTGRVRHIIHEISDTLENEGDRVYLASTNDADTLKALAEELDDLRWEDAEGTFADCNFPETIQILIAERDGWKANSRNATSVIGMIRAMIGEMFGPIASIESEDATLLRGPEPKHTGEAILEALQRIQSKLTMAQVNSLQEALAAVENCYFAPDNDIEEAQHDGITTAHEAVSSLLSTSPEAGK